MAPASLRVHRVSASRRSAGDGSAALVLAAWDRDGGAGLAALPEAPGLALPLETLGAEVLGQSAYAVAGRWARFTERRPWLEDSLAWQAFGALETALADLCARRHGLPLWQWLGGAARRGVAAAVTVPLEDGEEDPAALAARLGRARALGARGCTVWLGRDELPRALRLLGQLRAPPGPGLPLRLAFGSSAAGVPDRDLWPQLEALHLELVVDAPNGPGATPRALRRIGTEAALRRAILEGPVRALVLDPIRWGGPPGVARIAAVARAFQVELALGCETPLELSLALARHLTAATGMATLPVELDPTVSATALGNPAGAGPLAPWIPGAAPGLGIDPAALAGEPVFSLEQVEARR